MRIYDGDCYACMDTGCQCECATCAEAREKRGEKLREVVSLETEIDRAVKEFMLTVPAEACKLITIADWRALARKCLEVATSPRREF